MKKQRSFFLKPNDLLDTALFLVNADPKRPRDANLRRALSSIYYACFHTLAEDAADLLAGKRKVDRKNAAWRQVYRSLLHRRLKESVKENSRYKATLKKFPAHIQQFANKLVHLQGERHSADYDPFFKISKSSVLTEILQAEALIANYKLVSDYDRRAFCVFVLFELRN